MESDADGSVTGWFGDLKRGDRDAAGPLWERYYERLVRLARSKLVTGRAMADEEDAALSAFDSFCRAAAAGRFPDLADRDELWRLLVAITANKAINQSKREGAQKRGGGRVLDEAALVSGNLEGRDVPAGLEQVAADGPTPDFAAMVAEEYGRLLDSLGDEVLRQVAVRKMEGYSSREIAGSLSCSEHTVANKLRLIRKIWESSRAAPRPGHPPDDAPAD